MAVSKQVSTVSKILIYNYYTSLQMPSNVISIKLVLVLSISVQNDYYTIVGVLKVSSCRHEQLISFCHQRRPL